MFQSLRSPRTQTIISAAQGVQKIIFSNTSGDALLKTLLDLGPQLKQKAVLFPCTDMAVLTLRAIASS